MCICRGLLLPCLAQSSCAACGLQQYNIRNLVVEQVRGDPRGLSDMRRSIDVRRYKAAIVVCGECVHLCCQMAVPSCTQSACMLPHGHAALQGGHRSVR